ncbi:hypothetical protein ACWGIN_27110 [Streptomyces sp. NPDC054861]
MSSMRSPLRANTPASQGAPSNATAALGDPRSDVHQVAKDHKHKVVFAAI